MVNNPSYRYLVTTLHRSLTFADDFRLTANVDVTRFANTLDGIRGHDMQTNGIVITTTVINGARIWQRS
jgi:hypothetical protein